MTDQFIEENQLYVALGYCAFMFLLAMVLKQYPPKNINHYHDAVIDILKLPCQAKSNVHAEKKLAPCHRVEAAKREFLQEVGSAAAMNRPYELRP